MATAARWTANVSTPQNTRDHPPGGVESVNFETFRRASRVLRHNRSRKRPPLKSLEAQVQNALAAQDNTLAIWLIEQLLKDSPEAAHWWNQLGLLRARSENPKEATRAWQQALINGVGDAEFVVALGRNCREFGVELPRCEVAAPVTRDPSPSAEGFTKQVGSASNSVWKKLLDEDFAAALPDLERVYWQRGQQRVDAANLAFVLQALGQGAEAHCILAVERLHSGKAEAAARRFELAASETRLSKGFAASYFQTLRLVGREDVLFGEVASCGQSLDRQAREIWHSALVDCNGLAAAAAAMDEVNEEASSFPLALMGKLALQTVPTDADALDFALARFESAVQTIESLAPLDQSTTADNPKDALRPSFLLGYQIEPDSELPQRCNRALRSLLRDEAGLTERASGAIHGSIGNRRIRIGYATSYASFHTVSRYFAGWIEQANREQFELHLFPLATEMDWMSDYLRKKVNVFHPPAHDWQVARQQIQEADLDVLIFPEVGMDPLTFRLACSRLARVQCAAWGHPISTGLKDIDYFLSADSMETAESAKQYTEQLVLLPGLGASIPASRIAGQRKQRADFGLSSEDVVFISPQSLFKYHPRDDGVFPEIAAAVQCAKIVFVEGKYPGWTRTFRTRLQHAFSAAQLDIETFVRFVPRQDFEGFLSLLSASDVFLDSIGWSGGMTSLDALACGVPVVTLPGLTMRSRQSAAMLQQLGLDETTANCLDDYVDIAIRLGRLPDFRQSVSARIVQRQGSLFEQHACVPALEAFLRWSLGQPQAGDNRLFSLGPRRG